MVVIDKLSKSAHFIPVRSTFTAINIDEIFMKEIFRLQGSPKMVILDRRKIYIHFSEGIICRAKD
jgi:hypothetical protein